MTSRLFSIEKAIRIHLGPHLRADGFTGSGRHFRRVTGGLIHVVNIQGSRYGRSFAINLGLHPLCLPDVSGNTPDPRKITEVLCEFRRRLSESEDQWWVYEPSQDSVDQAMREATKLYVDVGRQLFAEQSGADSPIFTVTPQQFSAGLYSFSKFRTTKVRAARALAFMRRDSGNLEHARAFAQIGLDNLRGTSGLSQSLNSLPLRCEFQPFTPSELR